MPAPPDQMNSSIPEESAIVMHLLEKEPDSRYQSAEGLIYDLERYTILACRPSGATFPGAVVRPVATGGARRRGGGVARATPNARRPMPWRVGQRDPGAGKTLSVDELRLLVADAVGIHRRQVRSDRRI